MTHEDVLGQLQSVTGCRSCGVVVHSALQYFAAGFPVAWGHDVLTIGDSDTMQIRLEVSS